MTDEEIQAFEESIVASRSACQGLKAGETCGKPPEFEQLLGNDPRSFCLFHAQKSTAMWVSQGWMNPKFKRLSDGKTICFTRNLKEQAELKRFYEGSTEGD